MKGERLARARAIFDSAVESGPGERKRLLAERCGADTELRAFVERLLANFETGMGSFLQPPQRSAATLPTSPLDEAGPSLLGSRISHYEIRESLGAGGMGEVYLAHDLALDRPAAFKVLRSELKSSVRDRLIREAWASAKVQHPAIATFYEAGRAADVDFIAMEYVRGETLRERMRRGPLRLAEALEIVTTVLEALVHAHFAGILHRDIKPENVMINEEGVAKLLDFGLAKGILMESSTGESSGGEVDARESELGATLGVTQAQGEADATLAADTVAEKHETPDQAIGLTGPATLTRAGAVLGTPGYMPPEQLRGQPVDERADVFAVGAVLYEAITGGLAFPGNTIRERLDAVLKREPPPIDSADVPAELAAVVARSIHRDPDQRPASAAEFLTELRRFGGGPAARAKMPIKIASLDFENRTGDERDAWIGAAIPDALEKRLAELDRVEIAPRQGVVEAARTAEESTDAELGLRLYCNLVVSGSYRREGSELRVTARLVDTASDAALIEEELTTSLDELSGIGDRFAAGVAASLGLELPPSVRSAKSFEAYQNCVRARRLIWHADRGSFEEARKLLERAIELEPEDGEALSLLAQCRAWMSHSSGDPEDLRAADEYSRRAIAADPSSGEVASYRAYVMTLTGASLADTLRAFLHAQELDPNDFHPPYFISGTISAARPRAEAYEIVELLGGPSDLDDPFPWLRNEALRHCQGMVEKNPKMRWAWLQMGWIHLELDHFAEARWCLEKAVELEPKTDPPTGGIVGYLAEYFRRRGELEQARELFLEALEVLERTDYMYRDTWRGYFLCRLGRCALDQGDEEAARAAFTQAHLHVKGRRSARSAGLLLVLAQAGLASSGAGEEPFEEAWSTYRERDGDFRGIWGLSDAVALVELARAAEAIGRPELAEELRREARDYGSSEE